MRGVNRDFEFNPAQDGVPSMQTMSFADIEHANGNNPNLFVTGILTFGESERNDIYEELHFPEWQDRFWTEDEIEDALLYPTEKKMLKVLSVQDILTIERIRGVLTKLTNTSIQKPIDRVTTLVNGRWNELLRGQRTTSLEPMLPKNAIKDDVEKKALKEENMTLAAQLKAMQEQIAALQAAKSTPTTAEKKSAPPRSKTK